MAKKPLIRTKKQLILLAIAFIALIAVLSLILYPVLKPLTTEEGRAKLYEWTDSLGAAGFLVLLGIQFIQIVIAFIPGEPVEIIAGVMYGTWGGLFLCLFGCVLASSIIFFIVRKFGMPLVERVFGKEKLASFTFLNDAKKLETVVFLLFLIPGTPKDMLTYVAGVSKIRFSTFIILSTIARIPSIITSTMMGATMRQENWGITLLLLAITALIGLLGIRYKDRMMDGIHNMAGRIKSHEKRK